MKRYALSLLLPVLFAGSAPGLIAGIFQVNFVAPQESASVVHLILGNGVTASFTAEVR